MGFINKIFTSVSEIYKNVNPITLSGVNDIIVIKLKNGDYKCSPFQLRFSKLQFLNHRSQVVNLYVNDKITEINMTITSEGDLYFEKSGEIKIEKNDKMMEEKLIDFILKNKITSEIFSENKEMIKNNLLENKEINKEILDNKEILENNTQNNKERFDIDSFINEILPLRFKNLKMRLFSKNYIIRMNIDIYNNLLKLHEKFSYLLDSTEHLEFLISRHIDLVDAINGVFNSTLISFSKCIFIKDFQSNCDKLFSDYQTTIIEDVDSLVVKLVNKGSTFYLSYGMFCKMLFEVRGSNNNYKKLLDILETAHSKRLGWNIFGSKKQIKRDIQFSLILNSKELESLGLQENKNKVTFKINGTDIKLEASIYLWNESSKVIVSDVDGTITKSDVWGHLCGFIGTDWSHSGVASLYTRIAANGYKIIYLSSRPLGQSQNTKNYLDAVRQGSYSLPPGPLILNPDGVFGAIYREIVTRNPEEFKIHALETIGNLWPKNAKSPWAAGFGNKLTDVVAYNKIKIPLNRIYTINTDGQLQAEYSKSSVGTYSTMNDFVDTIFPLIDSKDDEDEYKEFSWWR